MIRSFFKLLIVVLFVSLSNQNTLAQTIYYVDSATGSDANAGTSWTLALRNLNKALDYAKTSTAAEVQIWVGAGTYHPTEGLSTTLADPADTSFAFFRGNGAGKALKIYGGFAGTETAVAARDTLHRTFLDGNAGSGVKSYHVFVIAGLDASADSLIVDGFTIANGDAEGTGSKSYNGISVPRTLGGGGQLSGIKTSKVLFNNCSFKDHRAFAGGGLMNDTAYCSITNCNFTNCTGLIIGGGGIYNRLSSISITNCAMTGNLAFIGGSAIYDDHCSPVITNCRFSGNITRPDGVDMHCGGTIYGYYSSVVISGCDFTGNMAEGDGLMHAGAIFSRLAATPVITHCTFTNNICKNTYYGKTYGGAIYSEACDPQITYCDFTGNRAISVGNPTGGLVYSYGGALHNYGCNVYIGNCNFNANSATAYGYNSSSGPGNSYAYGGAIYNMQCAPDIRNCNFRSDTAFGIRAVAFGALGNAYGGGIYNVGARPNIQNCTFKKEGAMGNSNGFGGAIDDFDTSAPVLRTCTFDSCYAASSGGAIYHGSGLLTSYDCVFSNCTAPTGGAINVDYAITTLASLNSYRSVYFRNRSTNSGGAIYFNGGGSTDTLVNNVFALNKNVGGAGGGAIDITRGAFFMANNTFYADSAIGGRGGSVHFTNLTATALFANNIFYAGYGTGTSADTGLSPVATCTFTHNTFSATNPSFVLPSSPAGADGVWKTSDDGLNHTSCSAVQNTGDNAYVLTGETTDVAAAMRIRNGTVDIGAYETNYAGNISGPQFVCVGYTITLTDSVTGGSWVSSNSGIAAVSGSGVVTGVSAGSATIMYIVSTSCGTDTAKLLVTVNTGTNAGVLSGSATVCDGDTTTYTSTVGGGFWSVITGNAAVTASGMVIGLTPGIDTIVYTNSCHLASTKKGITVHPIPAPITGNPSLYVCPGRSITLLTNVSGGAWVSSDASIASIISSSGILTGVLQGDCVITYTSPAGCSVTLDFTVYPCPPADVEEVTNTQQISIYPNPVDNILNIRSNLKIEKIEILSMIGRPVFNGIYDRNEAAVNVNTIPSGNYIIRINGVNVYRFVKE